MDACVPFPKTSGARFNHIGILVTFSQAINSKGISLKHQNTTPRLVCWRHNLRFLRSNIFFVRRALSALSGGYLGNVMGSQPVLYAHHRDPNSTAFYLHDRVRVSFLVYGLLCVPVLIIFFSYRNRQRIVAFCRSQHHHQCSFMTCRNYYSSVGI